MLAFLVFAAVTGASLPAPSPSATNLPVIVRTTSQSGCTALRDTIMPVGTVLKKNDEAFGGMATRLRKIFDDLADQGGAPTTEQLRQEGDSKYIDQGTSAPSLTIDPGAQNNEFYSPVQIVSASQINSIADAVRNNLALATKVLDESLKALPKGNDPQTDEMRSRAQSAIESQRSFADNYVTFVNIYVNNQNTAWTTNAEQRQFVNEYLMALLTGKAPTDRTLPSSESARIASVLDVEQKLQQGERAFGVDLISTYNQCNGTHIQIAATPAPKASP